MSEACIALSILNQAGRHWLKSATFNVTREIPVEGGC
jgi:hypothetical protein